MTEPLHDKRRWKFYGATNFGTTYYQGETTPPDGTWVVPEEVVESLRQRLKELESERQAVLDVVNLYGDEVLHSALDGIGWHINHDGKERA